MNLKSALLICSLALAQVSCTGPATVSAGQVGCSPGDIEIVDHKAHWGSDTWVAICAGQRYHCTFTASQQGGGETSCTRAQSDVQSSTDSSTSGAGCQYDQQCKGDRVCDSGQCVSP